MEALSTCAVSSPETQDKFPAGQVHFSFLCYAVWTFVWNDV